MNVIKLRDESVAKGVECPRCGHIMTNIQSCHLRCDNCGAELTCSDKGGFW
jgi:transcription elongation factor Elf1